METLLTLLLDEARSLSFTTKKQKSNTTLIKMEEANVL